MAEWLEGRRHKDLTNNIRNYLSRNTRLARVSEGQITFTERYIRVIAEEIANTIERGDPLALGYLFNTSHPRRYSPYIAVFLWDGRDRYAGEIFTFTASRPEDTSSNRFNINNLDRHVSFQVSVEGKI